MVATPLFAAGSAGFSGPYALHSNIASNESDQTRSFSSDSKKITGTCKTDTGETKITGTADGNKVILKVNIEYNGNPLTVTYTGLLDASGTVRGDADV